MGILKRIKELEKEVDDLSANLSINRVLIKSYNWLNGVTVNFENKSPHPDPQYAKEGDSGFDLRAWIQETEEGVQIDNENNRYVQLLPHERRLIHTGIKLELPEHTEAQVRPRSGLAAKKLRN